MLFNSHTHQFSNENTVILNKSIDSVSDGQYFSFGVHPWDSNKIEDNFFENFNLIVNDYCLAIGEIGLDKLKGPDIEIQKIVFEKQILIAEKLELPVIIHCVKAWNELKSLKQKMKPKQIWVFHGFNKVGILNEILQTDMMISIGASIFANKGLQEKLNSIPNNRLLLETDDSELDIFEIYKKVSEIKKISLSALEEIIEENFKRTFRKWQSG